jgi:transcription elongation factor GreA-like protein
LSRNRAGLNSYYAKIVAQNIEKSAAAAYQETWEQLIDRFIKIDTTSFSFFDKNLDTYYSKEAAETSFSTFLN